MGQGQQASARGNAGQAAVNIADYDWAELKFACRSDFPCVSLYVSMACHNSLRVSSTCQVCTVKNSTDATRNMAVWHPCSTLAADCSVSASARVCMWHMQHCAGHVRFQQRLNLTADPDPRVGSAFTSYIAQSDLQQAINKFRASNCSEAYYLLTGKTCQAVLWHHVCCVMLT